MLLFSDMKFFRRHFTGGIQKMKTDRYKKFHTFFTKQLYRKNSFFLIYTVSFAFLAFLVYMPFLYNGKSFIWKPDGLTQHFNALVYFGQWMRSILRTLITEHRLSVPLWDFSIGYGSDILTTLHYYVIGDPLNLLAVITPVRFTEFLYEFLIILRLYLSGLSFSFFCSHMVRNRGRVAILAGSLSYAFCGYGLVLAVMHPYFINPMIYLPLLLLGAEYVMQKRRPHLLIAMTALSAISNFYFFYMLVILTILYCTIRFCTSSHEHWIQDCAKTAGRVFFYALLGTAIATAILLPICLAFISDARSESELGFSLFYGWDYYEQIFDQFLSLEYSTAWTYLGYTPVCLLSVFLLFLKKKKEYRGLKAAFIILTLMLLFPHAGSFMNGFSYAANRWAFGYSFLIALILVVIWPALFRLTLREKVSAAVITFIYLALLLYFRRAGSSDVFAGLALLLLTLTAAEAGALFPSGLSSKLPVKVSQSAVLFLMAFSICSNAVSYDRLSADSYMSRFTDQGQALSELEASSSGMMSLFYPDNGEFFRFAQDLTPVRNSSLNHNTMTIEYYWSLSNGHITQFFNELALPIQERTFKYDDTDNRAALQALASVRYYVSEDPNKALPYSYGNTQVYEYLDDIYYVSETPFSLPLGYTYDGYITQDQYDSMTYIQRQQALTRGLVCDTIPADQKESTPDFCDISVPCTRSCGEGLYEINNTFYASTSEAQLTLNFTAPAGCETYLLLRGVNAESVTELELYTTEPFSALPEYNWDDLSRYEKNRIREDSHYSQDISRFTFNCDSEYADAEFSYYAGLTESSFDRKDFLINLGYSETEQTQAVLTFPYAGIYSFESIEIISLPMQPLSEQLQKLEQESLTNVTLDTNHVSGTISVSEQKLLCLSIPWSEGWTARVDGQEATLFPANTMYMGLALEAGEHTIELSYRTPGLKSGLCISAAALTLWFLLFLLERKRRKDASILSESTS